MKKIITLLCSVLCCLTIVLADEPDSKNTNVAFDVQEVYEWTVPSATEFEDLATNQKLEDEVSVIKCLIANKNRLSISLDNEETLNDMLLEYGEDEVEYEIALTEGGTALVSGDEILSVNSGELTASGEGSSKTQNVYGKITGFPTKAGIYQDQLTFIAKVLTTDLTGYTAVLKENKLNAWYDKHKYDATTNPTGSGFGDIPGTGEWGGMKLNIKIFDEEYEGINYDQVGTVLDVYKEMTSEQICNNEGAERIFNPGFATLKITGGDDVANPEVVAFFYEVADISKTVEEEITDLTNCYWKLSSTISDEELLLKTENFYYSQLVERSLKYPNDIMYDALVTTDLFDEWPLELYLGYDQEGYYMHPSASEYVFKNLKYESTMTKELKWIKFVSGTELTNPDLIDFLQEIGSFSK